MTDRVVATWLGQTPVFGVSADVTGATLLALKNVGKPWPIDGAEGEDVEVDTGRDDPPEHVIVRDASELDIDVPLFGYAASSGDGAAAPALDALDYLLESGLGAPIQEHGGEGMNAGSAAGNMVADAVIAGLAPDDLACVYLGPAVLPTRSQVRRVVAIGGAPTYTIAPNWGTAPTTDAVIMGGRGYGQGARLQAAGDSVETIVDRNGVLFRQLGGRLGTLNLKALAGKQPRLTGKIRFDSWTRGVTAAARPAITVFPASMIFKLAPVWFNGTQHPVKSVEVDFGLSLVDSDASEAANGRADMVMVKADPIVTITPLYAPATWNDAFRAETVGELLLQFGGSFLGARANMAAFHALRAQVIEKPTPQSDGGNLRHQVKFRILGAGANGRRRWSFVRW